MKSKDDKSEDGSDQEREYLNCFSLSHLSCTFCACSLAHIYCVLRVFLAICIRLYLYRIYHAIFNHRVVRLFLISFGPRLRNRRVEFLLMIHHHVLCDRIVRDHNSRYIREKYFFVIYTE